MEMRNKDINVAKTFLLFLNLIFFLNTFKATRYIVKSNILHGPVNKKIVAP